MERAKGIEPSCAVWKCSLEDCRSTIELRPYRAVREGGSNFNFADASVRFIKYGNVTWPLNLWAISDADRLRYAFQLP